jgi:hypothetical protein
MRTLKTAQSALRLVAIAAWALAASAAAQYLGPVGPGPTSAATRPGSLDASNRGNGSPRPRG